jgi:benzoylformate decarboxylase
MPSIPDPCTDGDARTVREGAFDVFRSRGLTTVFSNPGSTEIDLLVGLPADFRFVLALHEAAAVGMATGYALMRGEPALVNLHTTAGLGNAVGALATARVNRAALVVLVGQQDRRHLALEPFLAGRLAGLGGTTPSGQPSRRPRRTFRVRLRARATRPRRRAVRRWSSSPKTTGVRSPPRARGSLRR